MNTEQDPYVRAAFIKFIARIRHLNLFSADEFNQLFTCTVSHFVFAGAVKVIGKYYPSTEYEVDDWVMFRDMIVRGFPQYTTLYDAIVCERRMNEE